jgi:hypothetical protein
MFTGSPDGGIGRRVGLKSRYLQECESSSLSPGISIISVNSMLLKADTVKKSPDGGIGRRDGLKSRYL